MLLALLKVLLRSSNTVKTLRYHTVSLSLHLSEPNEAKKTSRQETQRMVKPSLMRRGLDLLSAHLSELSADEE